MKINGSIRNKLIFAIFLGCMIPYFIGGAYLKSYTEKWLYNNSVDNTTHILHQVSELIDDSLIADMKAEVRFLSSLDSVKNSLNNLQSYTRYERSTFRYEPSAEQQAIKKDFNLLKSSHESINFIFLGTEDGGYMEYPTFRASQVYDPRERPWYQSAINSDDIVISEPYLTKVTNEMVISFMKQIQDDVGQRIGVLGIAVNLSDLTDYIGKIKTGESGYLLLLSPKQKFLVSPRNPEWIMKTPEELKLTNLNALNAVQDTIFEAKLDGVDYVMNVVTSKEAGWHIVSVVKKNEILHKAKAVTNILLVIYGITFFLIFLIVVQISKRFTKPILEISSAISRITDFDFSFSDYLKVYTGQKDEIGTVSAALVEMHDNYAELIGQLQETNKEINFLALHDPLTKLPNRRQFIDLLGSKLADGKKGAVFLLDLDDFKGINDTLGHVFGDQVIEAIAARLSKIEDENVVVSRFGGDEFLVLTEYREATDELEQLIQRIRGVFDSIFPIDNKDIELRFSMGISLFPEDGSNVDQLVMNADLAMYSVKGSGKNGYAFFDSSMMNSQLLKSQIEIQLRDAIENDGFIIVYQPQIDLKTGEIYGYEALLRLKESDLSPAEFVPIAEVNGSIARIGRIVTEKVICQLSDWKKSGLELKPVSINFSANQLHDSGYLDFIGHVLQKYGIEPHMIEIEITESIFLENRQSALAFLMKLKQMGIAVSIDDFGTGYSSLNYLTFLPVDKIKLDRSLNMRFLEMDSTMVMESLISLAHGLGLTVIAEGIETLDQVERLKAAGCDVIQGFYYSKPLDPNRVSEVHTSRFEK